MRPFAIKAKDNISLLTVPKEQHLLWAFLLVQWSEQWHQIHHPAWWNNVCVSVWCEGWGNRKELFRFKNFTVWNNTVVGIIQPIPTLMSNVIWAKGPSKYLVSCPMYLVLCLQICLQLTCWHHNLVTGKCTYTTQVHSLEFVVLWQSFWEPCNFKFEPMEVVRKREPALAIRHLFINPCFWHYLKSYWIDNAPSSVIHNWEDQCFYLRLSLFFQLKMCLRLFL